MLSGANLTLRNYLGIVKYETEHGYGYVWTLMIKGKGELGEGGNMEGIA